MQWVSTFWINLSSSLWFIPAAFILMAGGTAFGLVWLDSTVGWELEKRWPLLFGAGAEGSRTLLAAGVMKETLQAVETLFPSNGSVPENKRLEL